MKKDLKRSEKRIAELDKLIEAAFEEKVSGKIPESVCVKLIDKYSAEQTELKEKVAALSQGLEEVTQAKTDVDEFIRRLKTYFNSPALTREMCLALFDHLVIGGKESVTNKPQETISTTKSISIPSSHRNKKSLKISFMSIWLI